MDTFLRKLRGVLGTALTWAVGWAAMGFTLILGTWVALGGPGRFWSTAGPLTLIAGASGLAAGIAFATVLGTIHRHRSLGELSAARMALWGAGCALIIPIKLLALGFVVGVSVQPDVFALSALVIGGFGAATAGGTVRLAQRADRALGPGDGMVDGRHG